jgi:hypothetical protein
MNWLYRFFHTCPGLARRPVEGARFTCHACGQRWRAVWVTDWEEYTIMQRADIGDWEWVKVE